ncbi:MAG TPA: N-acetylmuramoyl-L-alanine amidase [Bryobacteraceae bacterium]|nr:N-acetylmuramoyl-L-alanine amidase [Bryobacteraceae bacterium]
MAITSVQCWSRKQATRVVIEIASDFQYSSDHISGPERIFFDFPGAVPELGKRRSARVEINDERLRGIRVAETKPGVTRVVFDLTRKINVSTARLNDPERLVIELREPGAALDTAEFSPSELVASIGRPGGERAHSSPVAPNRDDVSLVITDARSQTPARLSAPTTTKQDSATAGTRTSDVDVRSPAVSAANSAAPSDAPEVASAARRDETGRRSITRTLDLKIGTILIDAGHGGRDTGTVGPTGLMEKDLVLDIAHRLGDLISRRVGARVLYTRSDDTFVPLEERTRIANEAHADLFVSIHANSSPLPSTMGVETYYPNVTVSKGAMDVAERENGTARLSMFDLQGLIRNMALADKVNESRDLATNVQTALYAGSLRTGRTRDRGVRKAPFIVLLGAEMPSILAEIGFISNAEEEQSLREPSQRQRLAEALCAGVEKYAAGLSHFEPADHAALRAAAER